MAQDNTAPLEAQVISAAVEMGLSSQLDTVEEINVNVRTDLLNMVQGQVDSVSVSAQGLVMQKDIRVQEMEMQTDSIAINPLSAIFGDIKLTQPTGAAARVVLTERDINRALKSDYVRRKMQSLALNVDGKTVILEPQQIQIQLPGEGKVECSGKIWLHEGENSRLLSFIGIIQPRTSSQPLLLEAFQCSPGDGISLELMIPLLHKVKELLDLPYYEMEGTAFRVKNMEVQEGSLTVYAEAYVRQIPSL